MMALSAGRNAAGWSGRRCVSRSVRNGERTVREAKDKVDDSPGKYNGKSRERASVLIVENT